MGLTLKRLADWNNRFTGFKSGERLRKRDVKRRKQSAIGGVAKPDKQDRLGLRREVEEVPILGDDDRADLRGKVKDRAI